MNPILFKSQFLLHLARLLKINITDVGTPTASKFFRGDGVWASVESSSVADGSISTVKLGGDITTAGKALLDDADNTAQRTTLGLGSLATQSGTFSGTSSGTNTGDQDLSGKQATLVSGTNIKTVNGSTLLGSGDLVVTSTPSLARTFALMGA